MNNKVMVMLHCWLFRLFNDKLLLMISLERTIPSLWCHCMLDSSFSLSQCLIFKLTVFSLYVSVFHLCFLCVTACVNSSMVLVSSSLNNLSRWPVFWQVTNRSVLSLCVLHPCFCVTPCVSSSMVTVVKMTRLWATTCQDDPSFGR